MNFELKEVTEVLLSNINIRRELHGDEHVIAVDLSMTKEGGNELLNLIDPAIRTALYHNAAADKGQEALPEVLAVLPNLRLPKLSNQKFTWGGKDKYKGYRLILDYGLGPDQSNVDLDECTVGGFRFETKEGGTVVLSWLVQYAGELLTEEVRGRLTGLTQEKIHVQILAPAVLQLVKGGKSKAPAGDGDGDDLLGGEGDEDPDADEDTPEKAMERAHAAG
jgi:hypothetical protein